MTGSRRGGIVYEQESRFPKTLQRPIFIFYTIVKKNGLKWCYKRK